MRVEGSFRGGEEHSGEDAAFMAGRKEQGGGHRPVVGIQSTKNSKGNPWRRDASSTSLLILLFSLSLS